MAFNRTDYANYLCGVAVGALGVGPPHSDVIGVIDEHTDTIAIRCMGMAELIITRRDIADNFAVGMVIAYFQARLPTPEAPAPLHPVVCAIRNSKPAGTLRS